MSLLNTLPDELMRKIYTFLNPINEYINYVKALDSYNPLSKDASQLYKDFDEMSRECDINDSIHYITCSASISCLLLGNLQDISEFLKKTLSSTAQKSTIIWENFNTKNKWSTQ